MHGQLYTAYVDLQYNTSRGAAYCILNFDIISYYTGRQVQIGSQSPLYPPEAG